MHKTSKIIIFACGYRTIDGVSMAMSIFSTTHSKISKGGALFSPFISQGEKYIRNVMNKKVNTIIKNKSRMSRKICSIIFYIVCFFGMQCLISCIGEKEEPEWYLHPGDRLPEFEVTTINGTKVCASDSYSSELVIVFFNTTCVDCRRELPILQKQYEENLNLPKAEQSIYICISREEGAADVERYWTENHLTLPVSAQPDRHIYSMFASIGIPRVFYAKDGIITNSIYLAE